MKDAGGIKWLAALLVMGLTMLVGIGTAFAGTNYSTQPATNITATSATLNGYATSTCGLGGEFFSWGTTTSYGQGGAGSPQGVNGPVSLDITGLQCNTTYHYVFTGTPCGTTNQGTDVTFTTAACPHKVATGNYFSVAINNDGSLWTWGSRNWYGQLGDGTDQNRLSPIQISASPNWVSVSSGPDHTVALKSDGTLWSWGFNNHGQLGDGTTTNRNTPVQIGTDTDWASVDVSRSEVAHAIKTNGTLWTWGPGNSERDLRGNGLGTTDILSPVQVGTASDWKAVAHSNYASHFLKTNGELWGVGQFIGDGITYRPLMRIGTDTDWTAISGGTWSTFFLKAAGSRWAYGDGEWYQRGDNNAGGTNNIAQVDTGWQSVTGGAKNGYGIKPDGTLWGWGLNHAGQLGVNHTSNVQVPTQEYSGATNWVEISSNGPCTVARRADGTFWTTGGGDNGCAGDGTWNLYTTFHQIQLLLPTATVTATATGNGAGSVMSNTGGISYGYPATATATSSAINTGSTVVLTALANTGSTAAWTTCSGTTAGNGTTSATCTYSSLDANKTAQATFTLNTHALTVSKSGNGSGAVSGTGISCGSDCSEIYNYGTSVSLTATPGSESIFTGWSGACSGTGSCSVSITGNSSVGAGFALKCPTSSVTAPASSTTGVYSVSWTPSTSGASYTLYQNGIAIYSGTNTSYNVDWTETGSYNYTVKATKGGYLDSDLSGAATTAVTLPARCNPPAGLQVASYWNNTTGSYQLFWNASSTPGVTYVLTENGTPVYSGTSTYVNLSGRVNGTYIYRVKAIKRSFDSSAYSQSFTMKVTLTCAVPGNPYSPASSTSGSYQVFWNASATPGVSYTLYENGNPIYTGSNPYYNVSGRGNGSYTYRAKATRGGYVESQLSTAASTTVTLTCAVPGGLGIIKGKTLGSYQVYWNTSTTPGVTYTLYENGTPITGSNAYFNVSGKALGTYTYRVKAVRNGYVDSSLSNQVSITVSP